MRQLTYGADPEFFLCDENKITVPVCGWLGGTKEEHITLETCEVHEDGCAAEMTFAPETAAGAMVRKAQANVASILAYAGKKYGKRLYLQHKADVLIPTNALKAAGPKATTFGCSPEYDCYTGGESVPPMNPENLIDPKGGGAWRFAGGHIHLGYKELQPGLPEYVVAMLCDATIGAYLVYYGEVQGRRRAHYGAPGRFRPTPYGIEYRVPSNQWLYNAGIADGLLAGIEQLKEILSMSEAAVRAKWNSINWIDVRTAMLNESADAAGKTINEL